MKKNITQFIALVLVLTWIIGMLFLTASRVIHLILLAAIVLWLWRLPGKKQRVLSGKIDRLKK